MGGLSNNWQDWGWADRDMTGPGPAKINFSNYAGWILHHGSLAESFGALVFRLQAPKEFGDFLEVRLTSDVASLDAIPVTSRYVFPERDGWLQVIIPWYELNPDAQPFDGIRIRANRQVDKRRVLLDQIALTAPQNGPIPIRRFPITASTITVDCGSPDTPISPLIFGVAATSDSEDLRPTAYRFGGNPTSRFNWDIGNAWNTGADWYYRNVAVGHWTHLLELAEHRNAELTVTLPMLGWVAKDTQSYSFPVSVYGPQESVDPDHADAGNGVDTHGKAIQPGSPERTSTFAPPEQVNKWVTMILAESEKRGHPVHSYILDNEPCLWNTTHRDVHPDPVGYDELLDRTIRYGTAIRKADPHAIIAGPAEWGWSNYFWSAKDGAAGYSFAPDRRAHGDVPLLAWYLQKLAEHERTSGTHILDVVDLHFYPQGKGIYSNGPTNPETALRRIRSTRSLWDDTYVDESWVDERINLIPRMRNLIERYFPGRAISIGEWNFGAETHISGAIATAEALGRFAENGVHSAYYWTAPKKGTPSYWAFRAFRNFDGKGSAFLERFVPSTSPKDVSTFFSRNIDGTHFVAVLLALSNTQAYQVRIDTKRCGPLESWNTFSYDGKPDGLIPSKSGTSATITDTLLPPFSITVLDMHFTTQQR
jgi:hypothetical protein